MKKIKKWVAQHLWLISFLLILFVGGTTLSVFAQKMNKVRLRYTLSLGSDIEDSREDMVSALLSNQQADGGFSLAGNSQSDVDITGMALTALAPYYNSEAKYDVEKDSNKSQMKVSEAINHALEFLSKEQSKTGGFSNGGVENPESITQVLIGLTFLGIDPLSDERFIKEGNNLLDALMTFKMDDGGFVHSFEYDEKNQAQNLMNQTLWPLNKS